jgi:formylglycine-generating enzyme required for sulfatase activity
MPGATPWGNDWDHTRASSASYWAGRTIEFEDALEWKAFWVDGGGARIAKTKGLRGEVLTLPVGSFPNGASPYGVLDMAGNASEWVQDWYDPFSYSRTSSTNLEGPAGKLLKVVRGGHGSNQRQASGPQTETMPFLAPTRAEAASGAQQTSSSIHHTLANLGEGLSSR